MIIGSDLKIRSNGGITGTIPPALFALPRLQLFDASGCQLSGTLPHSALPYLTTLNLHANQLSGCVPDEYSTLFTTSGNSVDLSSNSALAWGQLFVNLGIPSSGVAYSPTCDPPLPLPALERAALTDLYASTNGQHWTKSLSTGWNTSVDPCPSVASPGWSGVGCSSAAPGITPHVWCVHESFYYRTRRRAT